MPFLNGGHLWMILLLLVVLVVMGPKRLPELGSSVGRAITEFRRSTTQLKEEVTSPTSAKQDEPVASNGEVAVTPVAETSPVASDARA